MSTNTSPSASLPAMQHGVSITGIATAALRAREQHQPQPLFIDSYASILAGPEGEALLDSFNDVIEEKKRSAWLLGAFVNKAQLVESAFHAMVSVRHRFFDDFVLESLGAQQAVHLAQGKADTPLQFVNVACGLDARAFRLAWPRHTHVYEIDRPEVLRYKAGKLDATGAAPMCKQRTVIEADVVLDAWDEQLQTQGFDPSLPSVWLAEGLLPYLPEKEVECFLTRARALSPAGSFVAGDHPCSRMFKSQNSTPLVARLKEMRAPLLSSTDDPEGLLQACGWDSPDVASLGDARAHYGRWPFPALPRWVPAALTPFPRFWLLAAKATT